MRFSTAQCVSNGVAQLGRGSDPPQTADGDALALEAPSDISRQFAGVEAAIDKDKLENTDTASQVG